MPLTLYTSNLLSLSLTKLSQTKEPLVRNDYFYNRYDAVDEY